MDLREVKLSDRFDLERSPILLSGTQALVRATLMQRARDAAAGHDTAGYVSGYRGSPLGAVDSTFQRAEAALTPAGVTFHPALNEDLAATAIWGAQQAHLRGEGRHEGVFAMWYGKGPGVDRSGDAFRHANLAGTAPLGG
ncbi:MAG: indolepyruvate ferredoxin oxidoreductase family protein, partial [Pseudomonadota bacterium]